MSIPEINKLVSSAKSFTFSPGKTREMSLMYNKNNNGPKTEPWDTPHRTLVKQDDDTLI